MSFFNFSKGFNKLFMGNVGLREIDYPEHRKMSAVPLDVTVAHIMRDMLRIK